VLMYKTLTHSTNSSPPRPTTNPNTLSFQFNNIVNTFHGSLLRFTDRDNNGFNVEQHLQYFFPERDKTTNNERGQMYSSRYCYKYTPRTPLKIVNVKSFTKKNRGIQLPEIVHEYFTHNDSAEVVRTQASDNLKVDNEFYKFILEKVAEKIPNMDGVYMPANNTAHEELVLQKSGLDKLDYERWESRPSIRERRPKKIRKVRIGKKLDFGNLYSG